MIHRASSTILDKKYLALRSIETSPIRVDLSRMVVNKPWGYEYLLTHTPLVEVWHLSLTRHCSTSTHCHPNKKTALIVLEGKALFSTLNGSIELKAMDAAMIDSGVFHSTQCISKKPLKLLEIETPPMKHDLIRLEDKYGRANSGYEGTDKMKTVNGAFVKFDDSRRSNIKNFCKSDIDILTVADTKDLDAAVFKKSRLTVVIKGFVKSADGKTAHSIGDVVNTKELRTGNYTLKNVSLLSIAPKK